MGQALRQPKIVPPPARTHAPASPGGGGGGVQPPLLVQIISDDRTSSPPVAREQNEPDRRIEMARRLKACGVRYYAQIAEEYPAALIEARVQEWREATDLGPGALVKMIQQAPLVVEAAEVPDRPPNEADWLERRYATGRSP